MRDRTVAAALLVCGALFLPAGAIAAKSANNSGQAATKLRKLKHEIARLQAQEASELKHKHRIQAQLATLEKHIGRLTRELQDLDRRQRRLAGRRKTLARKAAQSRQAAKAARQQLAATLRSAFVLGREPQIKLVLAGNDPATAARLLAYYGYYSKARSKQLQALTMTLAHYHKLQADLSATSKQLQSTAKARRASLAELKRTRKRRGMVLARLSHDIVSKQDQTRSLKRDAQRLEHIIHSVTRDLSGMPAKTLDEVDFSHLRGRLPWPVSGQMVNRFGASRAGGELKWEAVRIAAPAGTDVRAIAYGRIAYAGWLPYYGLVLIVDHGDGYLTVYGHNQALYKQVGDWVKAGEVLSTVGSSGGQSKAELYFQIRHRNHPLNPQRWCAHGHPSARGANAHPG